jgi:hypothetical protein
LTPEANAAFEDIEKENRHVEVNEIAAHLVMRNGSAHYIVHDVLQFHKVSVTWVPNQLSAKLKERRLDAVQESLKRFEAEGNGILGKIDIGNESAGNEESEQRMAPYLLAKTENFRTQPSAGKFMPTLIWDERGVILEHYMPRENSVTSATYADLLKNHLRPAI